MPFEPNYKGEQHGQCLFRPRRLQPYGDDIV
jgi:hypothetical protein